MTTRCGRPFSIALLIMALAFGWAAFLPGCSLIMFGDDSAFSGQFTPTTKILIVLDNRHAAALAGTVAQYRMDLSAQGVATEVLGWAGGSAADLRALLANASQSERMSGAFLVGTLPAAWYRQATATGYEEFPCDLYLMDPSCAWSDTNNDGRLDSHSPIALKYYVSRISGTDFELNRYFDKLHRFRAGSLSLPVGAFVFKDDSWFAYKPGSGFGLSLVYPTVAVSETPERTRRGDYTAALGGSSFEFVYQWIHSYPTGLCIQEGGLYNVFSTQDVAASNVKGLFFNLYNCSASRFTERNLGMTYLADTDYALAVFGSTKTGGCYQPVVFNQVLALKGTWGDAFRNWYVYDGYKSDSWFLGMVILGDPALTVSARGPIYRFIDLTLPAPPDSKTIASLEKINTDSTAGTTANFEEYRKAHPEFF